MPKMPTKAAGNVYCEARLSASSFNDRLSSREGAAEVSGIDRTRLARFELGTKIPHPEEVILMADSYSAPELCNWHCANDCPIGKKTIPRLTLTNVDRAILNFIAAYRALINGEHDVDKFLMGVTGDGVLNEEIKPLLNRVADLANQLSIRTQELALWVKKNIPGEEEKIDVSN